MTKRVTILPRLALEDDAEAIVDIAREAVEQTLPHHVFDPDKVRASFQRYIDTANPTFFVAEHVVTRRIVGFLKATMSEYDFTDGFYTTCEVISVRPAMRGSRAAALLLREFLAWSDMLGAKESTGGVDNGFRNDATTRFFCRFGFEVVGSFVRRRGSGSQHVEEGRR